jgi:hypothetical protein
LNHVLEKCRHDPCDDGGNFLNPLLFTGRNRRGVPAKSYLHGAFIIVQGRVVWLSMNEHGKCKKFTLLA